MLRGMKTLKTPFLIAFPKTHKLSLKTTGEAEYLLEERIHWAHHATTSNFVFEWDNITLCVRHQCWTPRCHIPIPTVCFLLKYKSNQVTRSDGRQTELVLENCANWPNKFTVHIESAWDFCLYYHASLECFWLYVSSVRTQRFPEVQRMRYYKVQISASSHFLGEQELLLCVFSSVFTEVLILALLQFLGHEGGEEFVFFLFLKIYLKY